MKKSNAVLLLFAFVIAVSAYLYVTHHNPHTPDLPDYNKAPYWTVGIVTGKPVLHPEVPRICGLLVKSDSPTVDFNDGTGLILIYFCDETGNEPTHLEWAKIVAGENALIVRGYTRENGIWVFEQEVKLSSQTPAR